MKVIIESSCYLRNEILEEGKVYDLKADDARLLVVVRRAKYYVETKINAPLVKTEKRISNDK